MIIAYIYLLQLNRLFKILLIALLGLVFLKGFKEAIGLAVVLVIVYLGLNAIVIVRGMIEVIELKQ